MLERKNSTQIDYNNLKIEKNGAKVYKVSMPSLFGSKSKGIESKKKSKSPISCMSPPKIRFSSPMSKKSSPLNKKE